MKRKARDEDSANKFGASPLVRRFASRIAAATNGAPILDVACGSGRNAMPLAELGCVVICVDIDLTQLSAQISSGCSRLKFSSQLRLRSLDLVKDPWPFGSVVFGGIVNVHFLLPTLFPHFENSLVPGGYLLIESIPGHGGNYLALPAAGEVKSALSPAFDFELYEERKVGPPGSDAVTVKLIAKRHVSL
jgi:SAM-dependent methyltransferase